MRARSVRLVPLLAAALLAAACGSESTDPVSPFDSEGRGAVPAVGVASELVGASHTDSDGLSTLYSIDPATGLSTAIGPIGFERVGGLAVDPLSGVLYGTGERIGTDVPVLITIDPATGVGTEVGPTVNASGNVADIEFDASWTLFLYDGANVPKHRIFTVNTATGTATLVGSAGIGSDGGNGIVFGTNGTLYHSNRTNTHTINTTTGAATVLHAFVQPCGSSARVNSADRHPDTGVLWGILGCASSGHDVRLVTVNYEAGTVSEIGPVEDGMDALAWLHGPVDPCATAIPNVVSTQSNDGGAGRIFFGTVNDDVIVGTSGPDLIFGFFGDDLICAGGGGDVVDGGPGDDEIHGEGGRDRLFGLSGEDTILGGDDNDYISGGFSIPDTDDDSCFGEGGKRDRFFLCETAQQ